MSSPNQKPLFEGRGLDCRRGGRLVFAGLDFSLGAGELLVLTGANGSGKSSLLRVLAGLLAPNQGELLWQGHGVRADLSAHRARLQYLGHLNAIKPRLTVLENLAFWARFSGGTDAMIREALAHFGLAQLAEVPGQFLSAGQKRRLALCRLLARPSELWLLDEPAVGLDRESEARLDAAIARHRAAGGLVVIASHTPVAAEDQRALSLDDFTRTAIAPAATSGDSHGDHEEESWESLGGTA
jgi:heme exporter protein A